jgi:SlyX protein
MAAPQTPEDRLVTLELLVTHLERDLGTLNSVLLEQRNEIEALKRLISRLDERVTRLGEEDEPRDPAEERPPHY